MNYAFVYGSFAGADRVSRIRLRRYSTRFDFDSSSECACARNQRIFPIVARRKIAIERATIFRPRRRSMKVSRGNFSCTGEGKKKKKKKKEKRASIEIKRKVIERFGFLTLLGEMERIDSTRLGFE